MYPATNRIVDRLADRYPEAREDCDWPVLLAIRLLARDCPELQWAIDDVDAVLWHEAVTGELP